MPSKNTIFTPSSILFRPQQKHRLVMLRLATVLVVEAPGTAPGSDKLITKAIYCHSHLRDNLNIGTKCVNLKRESIKAVVYCAWNGKA